MPSSGCLKAKLKIELIRYITNRETSLSKSIPNLLKFSIYIILSQNVSAICKCMQQKCFGVKKTHTKTVIIEIKKTIIFVPNLATFKRYNARTILHGSYQLDILYQFYGTWVPIILKTAIHETNLNLIKIWNHDRFSCRIY